MAFLSDAWDLSHSSGSMWLAQVFVYDTLRDELTLASRSRLGATVAADGRSTDAALSDDGRWVGFVSLAPDLVAGDLNAQTDVFLFGPARPGADHAVGIAAPVTFTPGTTASVTAVVVNLGPEVSRGVTLSLVAPAGLNLVSTTGPCVSWPCVVGMMGAGAFDVVTLTFDIPPDYTAPDPAVIRVTAEASTPDTEPGNNAANAVVMHRYPGRPGADARRAFERHAAPRADVHADADEPWSIGRARGADRQSHSHRAQPPRRGRRMFRYVPCLLGTLGPEESRTVTATFALPDTYAGPNPIHDVATASSGTGDANSANNSASADTILDAATPPLGYYTVTPCRLVDTRHSSGPTGGAALEGGVERWYTAAGNCDIPSTARAIVLNATVVGADGSGNVRLWTAGKPVPTASVVSYGAGQTRGVNAIVGLNPSGALAVKAMGSPHVHLILDVSGYFE